MPNIVTHAHCHTLCHPRVTKSGLYNIISCSQAAATLCLRPGLQQKRAAAALSQAGRAGPDQPIHAVQPSGRIRRPDVRDRRQTDRRQTASSLNAPPPGRGHNNDNDKSTHMPSTDRMYATDVRQTDVRQHHLLMPPGRGHNNDNDKSMTKP